MVNLAGDGAHFCVLADVMPVTGDEGTITGYRAERRSLSRDAVAAVAGFYVELVKTERTAATSKAGLDASAAQFVALLVKRNQSYPEFVRSLATV